MSKKYKFRISETNFLQFTEENLKNFKNVTFIDGKIIPVKRDLDGQVYDIIVPLELIKECENE